MIIILGPQGSGKSASIEGMDPETTILLTPNPKPLPWRGSNKDFNEERKNRFKCRDFNSLKAFINNINTKNEKITEVITEDLSHYFNAVQASASFIGDNSNAGFGRWANLGNEATHAIVETDAMLRPSLQLIIMAHTASDDKTGIPKLKVSGKLLEDRIDLLSYATFVLVADVTMNGEGKPDYRFITNKDGSYYGQLAKSPKGCLELYEPNCLKDVLKKIKEYYN